MHTTPQDTLYSPPIRREVITTVAVEKKSLSSQMEENTLRCGCCGIVPEAVPTVAEPDQPPDKYLGLLVENRLRTDAIRQIRGDNGFTFSQDVSNESELIRQLQRKTELSLSCVGGMMNTTAPGYGSKETHPGLRADQLTTSTKCQPVGRYHLDLGSCTE